MTYTDPKFRVFMSYLTPREMVQLEDRIRICDENRTFADKDRNAWLKFLALEKFAADDTLAASYTSDASIHTTFESLVERFKHREPPKAVRTWHQTKIGVLGRLSKEAKKGKLIVLWWAEEDGEEGAAENVGRHVYFLQAGTAGLIKIGCSQNPFTRRTIFQHETDEPLQIRKVYLDAGLETKRMFHRMFAKARIRGEWFSPTDELMQIVTTANY